MSDGFRVEHETNKDGVAVVRPVGDVDLSRSPLLREAISEAQRSKPLRIIVDLSGVPYMDSSGVATLVEAMTIARKKKCKLILCHMQDKVRAIFEITRLDMVFTIVDTCEDAQHA